MSHITDGDLHAYLDGALEAYGSAEAEQVRAHLESCADCAQRLDGERALRERATGILAGADLDALPLASLEELQARAAATGGMSDGTARSRFSPRSPYVIGMGWAATIALALWTGYSVKDFAPNPAERSPVVLEPMRELDAVSADDQPAESTPSADQVRASGFEAEEEASGLLSSEDLVRRGVGAGAPVDRVAGSIEDPDVVLGEERNRQSIADAELPERLDAKLRKEAAPVDQPPAPASEVFADVRANESPAVAGTVANARKTLEQGRYQEGATAVGGMLSIIGERAAAGVPGLEITRMDTVEVPGLGQAMLIVHVLPSGGDLELWSLSNSGVPAVSRKADLDNRTSEIVAYFRNSLARGWSMTVRERPGGVFVARAPLPQEELDALMESVPGGG